MAHLGTYTTGGITYDRHTGRAIGGTDTVDAEFAEEFNGTYVEINLDNNPLISDDQPNVPNIFDATANMYMNANGEMILTNGRTNDGDKFNGVNGENQNRFKNDGVLSYYDFSKPNQKNGDSFTNIGKNFYAPRGDYDALVRSGDVDPTEKNFQTWQREKLIEVEDEIKSATISHFDKVKKSNPNQVKPLITKSKEELKEGEKGALSNAKLQEAIDEYQGLHSTDYFLQRLSLKNLKYPVDADYGNTQDYIQINQFTYRPPNPDILFGEDLEGITDDEKIADKIFDKPISIITNGLESQSPKEKHIGLVKLPMPNDLKDSNNVAWGQDQLNAITAAAANLTSSGLDQGIKLLQEIRDKDKGLFEGIGQVFGAGGQAFGQVLKTLEEAQGNANANLLGRSVVGAGILNFAGFGLSPEAILARGAGIIPNSNLQLLFNAPTLRSFRFNWKMSPRSRDEAIRINNILRFFKQGMAVKKQKGTSAGGASYFLATPNVFDISFRTSKTNRGITNLNNSVLKMKTCACTGVAVNYAPQGMWNAYEEGQPTSCILSLEFKELEPIYNTDYDEDPFKYEDLTGFVPENAVGY